MLRSGGVSVCKHCRHPEPVGCVRGIQDREPRPFTPVQFHLLKGEKKRVGFGNSCRGYFTINSALQTRDNEMENPNGQNEYIIARSLTA